MNLPPSLVGDPLVAQQQPVLHQQSFPIPNQWTSNTHNSNNGYGSYQLPLQLSQYYNVFPDVPSTRTSWTFPNGCVTSNIVRFTGLPTPTYPVGSAIQSCHSSSTTPIKRKSLPMENEVQPSKIFITEEKMTARMNDMHISNEFVSYDKIVDETLNSNDMDDELLQSPESSTPKPKLIICDELKNLRGLDPIIPETFVPAEKPSTALMIWRPLASYVNTNNNEDETYSPRSSVIITDITDRPDLENNNISTVDLNTLVMPPHVEYPPESIDEMEL